MTTSERLTKIFRTAFNSHPSRETDPALALDSAREDVAAAAPDGVTYTTDDETLTVTCDTTTTTTEDTMTTYRNTDERYGDATPFEAESIEAAVLEMEPTFRTWAVEKYNLDENADTTREQYIETALATMRREYADALEVVASY